MLTDRAFKVRSGKVLRKLKSIDADVSMDLYTLQEKIDECVSKYFDEFQFDQFKEANPEYSDIVIDLVTKITRKGYKVREYPVPDVKVKPTKSKDKTAKTKGTGSRRSGIKWVVTTKPATPKVAKVEPTKPKVAKVEPPKAKDDVKPAPPTDKVDVVFSFDDTGSMSACRNITRKLVDEISAELLVEFGDKLNVGVIIHGDYCDCADPVASLPMTKDWVKIKKFLNETRSFGGGDAPECYELVLNRVQDFEWRVKSRKVLVLIGDEVPHEPTYRLNTGRIDWKEEVKVLAKNGVQIISVQALNNSYATSFYSAIAEKTGGHHLRLTQLNQTADLLRAICYDSCGQLSKYEDKHKKSSELTSSAFKRNIDILAGRASTPTSVDGLSEFQMFNIGPEDHDMRIMDYVRNMGMTYKAGCGYYEFMKPELVQDYKKVVVQDRETEIFYPDMEGRRLLKLPESGSMTINPKNYDKKYRFFIQSTSYTRKLKSGTTFLYDNR